MRNWPVLAEDTSKITIGEEDRTRPISAHQGYLFSIMGVGTKNYGSGRGTAESSFTFFPVCPTMPWAELAVLEDSIGLFDPLSQFPLFLQVFIGRLPGFSSFLSGVKGDRIEEE